MNTGPEGTNDDIVPVEGDEDSKDRPRLDKRPDPLDEPLLEPREELTL